MQHLAAIAHRFRGHNLQIADRGIGVRPAVGLHPADHHIGAAVSTAMPLVQHRICFADTGGVAQIDAQPRGLRHGSFYDFIGANASSARFSLSTLTRGSPKMPRSRPVMFFLIRSRTVCSDTERVFATRGAWANAASGEMSGSRPEPDVVNRSAGNTVKLGFSAFRAAASLVTRSISFLFVGPRLEPPDEVAS